MDRQLMEKSRAEPMFRYIMMLNIAMAIGTQSWLAMLNNFAFEEVAFDGAKMGILQSVREIPGFLALLVVYVILIIREHRLAAMAVGLSGIGVAVTGLFPSFSGLLLTTTIMSVGFHYFETVHQSLTLQYFGKESAAWVMGKMKSFASMTNIVAGGGVLVLTSIFAFKESFLLAGLPVIAIALWAMTQSPHNKALPAQQKGFVLRKKYSLYYALTLMAGARRQIFTAFAIFLLVEKFRFSVQEVAVLAVFNNIAVYFIGPMAGRLTIRFGERKILGVEYAVLIIIFIGYAITESAIVAAMLYVLDHIFFTLHIAINTYFQKIADHRDVASSMAVGFTINHIAAIIIPVTFGILWMVDYRIPFLLGAVMAFVSLLLALMIKTEPARGS
jgi:predicted MFS family arabinose efflux permease